VLGLTANAQPQETQRCLEAGMNDCLFKPVTRSVLEHYLREAESARLGSACCFDMSKVNDITAGDAAMTRQLLATVLRTNQEDFDALQSLYSAGDFSGVGRRCHKILGSARIIHATALISACEQLEQHCQDSAEASELSQALDLFVKQMNLLQQQIRASVAG
jgi:two-component system sensor histidine kinase EvgS